jgi:hypothetical protein
MSFKFYIQLFCKLFSLLIICCLLINCANTKPAGNSIKLIKGDFIIKTLPEKEIIIDAPRMLLLSQEQIEEKLGKSTPMLVFDGVEERVYLVKSKNSQESVEVHFGYFNSKPSFCRLYTGSISDWETALNLVGIDTGHFYSQESSTGKNYWYRGDFENYLFDLTAIIYQADDVIINSGIDAVLVEIYLSDEIVFQAKRIIGKAKTGASGRREIEKIKNKLKTISEKDEEYSSAQQLIKEIDEILPKTNL